MWNSIVSVPYHCLLSTLFSLSFDHLSICNIFGIMRGFAKHETNNLKTSLRFPFRELNTIIDYFSPSILSFISTAKKCIYVFELA